MKPSLPAHFRRRHFLKSGAAALAGAGIANLAPAADAIVRRGEPSARIGLAAYSFRQYFEALKGKPQQLPAGHEPLTMHRFVDYCAEHGVAAELTSYFFPPGLTDEYLLDLRRHAFLRNVAVSGTAVGNDFTLPEDEARDRQIADVKAWIDRAAVLGAPHIRVFAGSGKDMPPEQARELCAAALQECCDYAGERGIFLGLENHGGIVAEADGMLAILKAVDSPWFGVNLDTGNFHTADPYGDLARVAPYAVNVQVKVVTRAADSEKEPVDLQRLAAILREANYQGFVTLEYEESDNPFEAVPAWLGRLRDAFPS